MIFPLFVFSLLITCLAGEKTKWVPIPAEELRAAADAHRSAQSSSASHSRSQSQQRTQNRAQGSTSGSASRSNHASQERSKAQSSVGRDRPSATHSEVHSRSGSLHSSPKHPSVRLRRYPDEAGGSSSRKSSRANSPYPPASIPIAVAVVEVPHGPVSHTEIPIGAGYPLVPHVHSPYSVTPPYPPPPGPIPPSYPALSYASYPYGGQPYPMFWSAIPQDNRNPYSISSQSQSPAAHPPSLARSDGASPPTSAEENSEATSAPANANVEAPSKEPQRPISEQKSLRGRQRLLSFGSIRADGKIIGGNGEATEVNAGKSDSLGPDVGSIKKSQQADATPRNTERITSKLNPEVPAFSVGVVSGNSGPSDKKPQATAVVSNGLTQGAIGGNEQTPTSSTSKHTWEFGTTGQEVPPQDASATNAARGQPKSRSSEGAANPLEPAAPEGIPLRVRLSPLSAVVNAEGLPPTPIPPSAGPALYANNNPLSFESSSKEDEWRVRDFGYGFGRRPDGSYTSREDRPPAKDRPYYGGRSGPRSYELDGFRRGFGGRRARGYGRGGRRGDNRGSSSRYASRDMGFEFDHGLVYGVHPMDASVYYIAPPIPPGYMPAGYDVYGYGTSYPLPPALATTQPSAPVPAPLTRLSFPLDPIRHYLLGQLEYYLSEDNMAQDFYLRQQVRYCLT